MSAPGRGVGHGRLDQFLALLAVAAGDDVFDDFRFRFFYVLDDPLARFGRFSDRAPAHRTFFQGVFLVAFGFDRLLLDSDV